MSFKRFRLKKGGFSGHFSLRHDFNKVVPNIRKKFRRYHNEKLKRLRKIFRSSAYKNARGISVRPSSVSRQDLYNRKAKSFKVYANVFGDKLVIRSNSGWYVNAGQRLARDHFGPRKKRAWLFVTQNIFQKQGKSSKKKVRKRKTKKQVFAYRYGPEFSGKPYSLRHNYVKVSKKNFTKKSFASGRRKSILAVYRKWKRLRAYKVQATESFVARYVLMGGYSYAKAQAIEELRSWR